MKGGHTRLAGALGIFALTLLAGPASGVEVRNGLSDGEPRTGSEVFELRWIGRDLEVVEHLMR